MLDSNDALRVELRILATTDLHMNLLDESSCAPAAPASPGLARVASLIHEQRRNHRNSLLFDNGDFLHGTPLADFLAEISAQDRAAKHPMIAAMNQLGYDAITLGNHDFAYGGEFLRNALRDAQFPVISSNLTIARTDVVKPYALLHRQMIGRDGLAYDVKIGVVGVLPTQTTQWDRTLQRFMSVQDMKQGVDRACCALRAQGAAIIILLAHSGIAEADYREGMENGAAALAASCDVDVIVAGHTHLVFPQPEASAHPADPKDATLAGKPAVMAGFWGSHLGQIDLVLQPCPARGWRIASATSTALPALSHDHDVAITTLARPHLARTARYFDRKLARTSTDLHSHFALLGQDGGQKLVALAQRWYAKAALRGTQWQDLPILATTNPSRAGGRSGPNHYTDIPAGPLHLRDLTTLYPYPNRITALQVSGEDISDWLERSASAYHQLHPDRPDQQLINPDFPSYNFDVIDGLEWLIDLGQPPRYAPNGALLNADRRRIRNLRRHGVPVQPEDRFVLVTNSYRHATNGLFGCVACGKDIVLDEGKRTRDMLRLYLRRCRNLAPQPASGFGFVTAQGQQAIFDTSPLARDHLQQIAHFAPREIGMTDTGFLRLQLHL